MRAMNAAVFESGSKPGGQVSGLRSSNVAFTMRTFISSPSARVPG